MTSTLRPVPRANLARRQDVPGTRVGYRPTPAPEPCYFPSKGAHFGNRLIFKHPQAVLSAHRKVGAWLAAADPRTDLGFGFLAAFWDALNDHVTAHGEMALFLRHNHI